MFIAYGMYITNNVLYHRYGPGVKDQLESVLQWYGLTEMLHIWYNNRQYVICANGNFQNNLILVVGLVKQISLTCFVVDGSYFAHRLPKVCLWQ